MSDGIQVRHARRWAGRIGVGAAVGAGLGFVAGLIWGSIAFGAGPPGTWLVALACVL